MDGCKFDPRPLVGVPIGMFHCPECGEMVIAGLPHTPEIDSEESEPPGSASGAAGGGVECTMQKQ
jgi:hypothetical protein